MLEPISNLSVKAVKNIGVLICWKELVWNVTKNAQAVGILHWIVKLVIRLISILLFHQQMRLVLRILFAEVVVGPATTLRKCINS